MFPNQHNIMPGQWSYLRFAELFNHNPRTAFEYRRDCIGEPIPAEYLRDDEKAGIEEVIEEGSDEVTEELVEEAVQDKPKRGRKSNN